MVCAFVLMPSLVQGQDPVLNQVILTPKPDKITEFEAGLASHNKRFHSEGQHSVNVFWISNGKNAGKYVWSTTPVPWAAMDKEHPNKENHEADWNKNVAPYTDGSQEAYFFKYDLTLSHFPKDFTLKYLSVFMLDMKRFKNREFMALLEKIKKVYAEKMPDRIYGIYFNAMPSNDDRVFERDFGWVEFFDSMATLGAEDKFPQYYEEVHGSDSFASFLSEFEAATKGDVMELWVFRKDLSGTSGEIIASNR